MTPASRPFPPPEWATALPAHLADLKLRRRAGELACLRRVLRSFPDLSTPALRIVIPYARDRRPNAQDAAVLTAGLWAEFHSGYHDAVPGRGDLGQALRSLGPDDRDRLVQAATRSGAPVVLRRNLSACIVALAARGVAPEWARLHADIFAILSGYPDDVWRRWLTGALLNPTDDETDEA
jgi:CRISPR-associated protein Cse2 (CRISPR_cse2)